MSKYLLLMVTLIMAGSSFAQPKKDGPNQKREDRIQAQKIAFISNELELTPKEAEVFWPIYNEYEAKIKELRLEKRKYLKELKNINDLSNDRAYELTEKLFDTDCRENDIRSKYLGKFAEVLDKKKAARVFMAEEKFKRWLIKTLEHGPKGEKKGGGGPGPKHH